MMIGRPVFLPSQSPAMRARVSVAAPAATGTTIRMGFDDSVWAGAQLDHNRVAHAIQIHEVFSAFRGIILFSSQSFCIVEIDRYGAQQSQQRGDLVLRQS